MRLRKTTPALEYRLQRTPEGVECHALRPGPGGKPNKLRPLRVHTAEGFRIGEESSGLAELALSIAVDLFQAPRVASLYRFPRGRAADAWVLHGMLKARWLADVRLRTGQSHRIEGAELYAWALEQRDRWARALEENRA